MFKTLTAGLMALTLTFTSATSAQAQGLSEEDVGKLLFGIIATAAIASAIKNNRDDRSDRAPRAQQHRAKPQGVIRHNGQARRNNDHRRANHNVLPRQCLRNFESRHGAQRMLVRRCLEQNYTSAASLPNRCAVRTFTNRGPRNGFDPQCLRERGYRISRN